MNPIDFEDFLKVDLRVGRILSAKPFPEAKKPAYQLEVDFGCEIGIRKTSAQITDLYTLNELPGKLVVGVVNLPKKQIGPFVSECLITGFPDEHNRVVLCQPSTDVPLGARLY